MPLARNILSISMLPLNMFKYKLTWFSHMIIWIFESPGKCKGCGRKREQRAAAFLSQLLLWKNGNSKKRKLGLLLSLCIFCSLMESKAREEED